MKIDEACINHNVVNIAKDCSKWITDSNLSEHDMKLAAINLAYIAGTCDLAERLKEVLKK